MKISQRIFTKKLYIFLIFVLFATTIWFLNSLNKEYITEINIPISYNNLPSKRANISELPENFTILVKAYGFDILKYQLKKSFNQTQLDLASIKFMHLTPNDTNRYYILSNEFIEQIKNQFNINLEIESIKPDTLYFHFTTLENKKVPVVLNAKIYAKSQFAIKNMSDLSPDSVIVSGPKIIVDTINQIKTKYFELKSLTEDISYKALLEEIDKIQIKPTFVDVNIEVEEYTEIRFKVPIETINVPDSTYLHLFPNYVNIVCKVGYSNYNKISASDFRAKADYFSIFENPGNKLMIEITDSPKNIYEFSFSPEFVEYVIEK